MTPPTLPSLMGPAACRAQPTTTLFTAATILPGMMTSFPGMGVAKKCPIRRMDEKGSQDGQGKAHQRAAQPAEPGADSL